MPGDEEQVVAEEFASVLEDGRLLIIVALAGLPQEALRRWTAELRDYSSSTWRAHYRDARSGEFLLPLPLWPIAISSPSQVQFKSFDDLTEIALALRIPEVGAGPKAREADARSGGFTDLLLESLVKELQVRLREYRAFGRDLAAEWDPAELGRELIRRVVPEPSPWSAIIGPVLRTASFAARLGLDAEDVEGYVEKGTVLALTTEDGVTVFPEFQLSSGGLLPGFGDVLQRFDPESVDGWTLAAWLVHSQDELGGASVVEALREGKQAAALAASSEAARRFSQ